MRVVNDPKTLWVCDDCGELKRPTVTFTFHGGFETCDVMLCGRCLASGLEIIIAETDKIPVGGPSPSEQYGR